MHLDWRLPGSDQFPHFPAMPEDNDKTILLLANKMRLDGSSLYTFNLATELLRRGHSVELACAPGSAVPEFEQNHIPLTLCKNITSRLRSSFRARRLLDRARAEEFLIVHAQSQDTAGLAKRISRMGRVPFIVTVHENNISAHQLRISRRRASKVIAISEAVREELVNKGKVPKEKIVVIPNGVNVSGYRETLPRSNSAAPVVGVVGPLEQDKGQAHFIQAAKQILDSGRRVQFVIAGEGEEEESLRRQVAAYGLRHYVTFASDALDHRQILSSLDILVMPSLQEGLGIIILEAMAMGKPVIASDVGSVYSLVRENETGYLVQRGDPTALAERLEKLIAEPKLAEEMGRRAKRFVAERFNVSDVVNNTLEVYQSALREHAGGDL